jgi:hypothetical protein
LHKSFFGLKASQSAARNDVTVTSDFADSVAVGVLSKVLAVLTSEADPAWLYRGVQETSFDHNAA